ncbi:MAG: CAP domain-containing protein [Limnohabitans sp.]|nr:CAP domain-containing protein [Limnohabitans sp.]
MTLTSLSGNIGFITVLLALHGSGGGGGCTQTSTDVQSLNAQAVENSTLQNLLLSTKQQLFSTYAPQSEEEQAYRWLNLQRNTCGFGALKQNAMLDNSAQAHADWLLTNNQDGHIENQAAYPQAFTEASVLERADYQGYINAGLAETVVSTKSPSESGWGVASVRNLLNTPYHAWA